MPERAAKDAPGHPPSTVGRWLLSADEWDSIGASLRLSAREFEIVQCVFDDESESSIGQRLGISRHTVHTYLDRLYRKLGIGSRGQLLLRVVAEHPAFAVPKRGRVLSKQRAKGNRSSFDRTSLDQLTPAEAQHERPGAKGASPPPTERPDGYDGIRRGSRPLGGGS